MSDRAAQLTAWLVGSVAASLIPLALITFHEADYLHDPSFYQILGHGDLLIIAFTLTVAGVAQLCPFVAKVQAKQLSAVILAILGGFIVVAMEVAWYSDIAARVASSQSVPIHLITWGSLFLFLVSMVITMSCVSVAAECK